MLEGKLVRITYCGTVIEGRVLAQGFDADALGCTLLLWLPDGTVVSKEVYGWKLEILDEPEKEPTPPARKKEKVSTIRVWHSCDVSPVINHWWWRPASCKWTYLEGVGLDPDDMFCLSGPDDCPTETDLEDAVPTYHLNGLV